VNSTLRTVLLTAAGIGAVSLVIWLPAWLYVRRHRT